MRTLRSIMILAALGATARADGVGIEPELGVVVPTSKLHTFVTGGLELDYHIGQFAIGANAALTRPSYDSQVMDPRVPDGVDKYTIEQTELIVGLLASYRLSDGPLVPRLGAGPILHMLKSSETSSAAPGTTTSQQTKFGVQLVGGVDYRVGTAGFLAADLRFVYSKLDTMLAGDTNAGSLALMLGYRLMF